MQLSMGQLQKKNLKKKSIGPWIIDQNYIGLEEGTKEEQASKDYNIHIYISYLHIITYYM